MNIWFRVDSGYIIGTGHIYRCINLASYFNNHNIYFISKKFTGNIINIIRYNYIAHEIIAPDSVMNNNTDTWLGEDFNIDADKTIEIIKNQKIDYFIIDQYAIDYKWLNKIRPYVNKLMVIDDLYNRKFECDILLNQQTNDKSLYYNLVPAYCKLLLGNKYSIIHKNILNYEPKTVSTCKRINIYMGGSDITNETEKIINVLIKLNLNITIDVIIGMTNSNMQHIINICENYNIKWYTNLTSDDIYKLFLYADLCIGALGMTTYERCILGIPSLTIMVADNQKYVVSKFAESNTIVNLGTIHDNYEKDLIEHIMIFYNYPNKLTIMSNNCKQMLSINDLKTFHDILNMTDNTDKLAINGGNPIRNTMLQYGKQTIDSSDINAVVQVLTTNTFLTTGPLVKQFEDKFSQYVGSKYSVAVSNGTAALHVACFAAGITKHDEVIVTTLSFSASANCILYCGGTPIFCDVEENTLNIDVSKIEPLITNRTKALIVVDFTGQSCDYSKILPLVKKYKLILIEDAAHALGCVMNMLPNNPKVGSVADLTTFSFHPVKHITTCEGGMVTTNNEIYYKRMMTFRTHGITKDYIERNKTSDHYYEQVCLGYNYRIPDILCALGINQLTKINEWIHKRKAIATYYDHEFKSVNNLLVPLEQKYDNSYHIYIIKLKLDNLKANRDTIFKALKAEGIGVNVHYIPIHLHPYYKNELKTYEGLCHIAEKVYKQIITLPIFPTMTYADMQDVVKAILKVVTYYKK